ncbi:MAG: helix-turn-helix domain-containing protein [Corynebacterium glutamicum]|nr:helix-turn-helix domain-containing protein [Corynebacterium glutamicum]
MTETISRKEAATMLNCSERTIDEYRQQGKLGWTKPGFRVRINTVDVKAIQSRRAEQELAEAKFKCVKAQAWDGKLND